MNCALAHLYSPRVPVPDPRGYVVTCLTHLPDARFHVAYAVTQPVKYLFITFIQLKRKNVVLITFFNTSNIFEIDTVTV